jgi:hypothetical protein
LRSDRASVKKETPPKEAAFASANIVRELIRSRSLVSVPCSLLACLAPFLRWLGEGHVRSVNTKYSTAVDRALEPAKSPVNVLFIS